MSTKKRAAPELAPGIPKRVPKYLAERVSTWELPSESNMSSHSVWLRKGWKFYSWIAAEILHEANDGTVAGMVDLLRRAEPCDCSACLTAAGTTRQRAPGAGRPKSDEPSIKVESRQPPSIVEAAREIGEGNVSAGIRAAIEIALPIYRRKRAGQKAGGK